MKILISELVSDEFSRGKAMKFRYIDLTLEECLAHYMRYDEENGTPRTFCITYIFDDEILQYSYYLVARQHTYSTRKEEAAATAKEIFGQMAEFFRKAGG